MEALGLYIDGAFRPGVRGATRDILNPATGECIARTTEADAADVDVAVGAARRAFDCGGWTGTAARDRGRVLATLSRIVRARAVELAGLETLNAGKPIAEAEDDVDEAANCFEYYAGLATKVQGEVIPVPGESMMFTLREPMGVAAQVIPWNFPLLIAAWKIAPALCAGCTLVLKPAEHTPLTVLALAESFNEAGLPPGVVNIVSGAGEPAGAALVSHAGVDKIAFTGSPAVGRSVMQTAARSLKRVSLELGGKSPSIFFADADFEPAVHAAQQYVFFFM